MRGRAFLLLGLAALCGVGAMFGVKRIITKTKSDAVATRTILVAARDIQNEETMAPDMATTKEYPLDIVPAGALDDPKSLNGRWALDEMKAGEPILDSKLAMKGEQPGLRAKISPGKRAFAVPVDEQSGVSGLILPDHHVDVIQSVADKNGTTRAFTLLENVRVLAAGSTFERPENHSIQAHTVTLEVSPLEAERLSMSLQKGALKLTLRGVNDDAKRLGDIPPEPELEPAAPAVKKVLVAAHDIQPGETVSDEMVMLKEVPIPTVLPRTLEINSDAVGRVVDVRIFQGEQILDGKLLPRGEKRPEPQVAIAAEPPKPVEPPRLSTRFRPGHRALSLRVAEDAMTVLKPDDHVDVVFTAKAKGPALPGAPASPESDPTATPDPGEAFIAQDLVLLAPPQAGATQGAGCLATLEVPVQRIGELLRAQREGTLSLVLRSDGDTAMLQPRHIDAPSIHIYKGTRAIDVIRLRQPEPRIAAPTTPSTVGAGPIAATRP